MLKNCRRGLQCIQNSRFKKKIFFFFELLLVLGETNFNFNELDSEVPLFICVIICLKYDLIK